jgi:hypothetical protein
MDFDDDDDDRIILIPSSPDEVKSCLVPDSPIVACPIGDNDKDDWTFKYERCDSPIQWDDLVEPPTVDDAFDDDYVNVDSIFANGKKLRDVFLPEFHIKPTELLYVGSTHTTQDFCRYMMALKQTLTVGDVAYAIIVGSIISFLPKNNVLSLCLEINPTTYKLLQTISVFAGFGSDWPLRTFQFDTCLKGCTTFAAAENFCEQCGDCRWKHCSKNCYRTNTANGEVQKRCHHLNEPSTSIYYMPMRDRITLLLKSDLRNLFYYDKYRKKCPTVCECI